MKTVNNRAVPTTDDLATFGKCEWTESLCDMLEELANTLGATEDSDSLALGPSSGNAIAITGTPTTGINITSTSTTAIAIGSSDTGFTLADNSAHALAIYTTCDSENASNSIEPFYMKSTMTGAGGVGGRGRFYMTTNVALGGWSNALKSEVTYGASGKTTGMGSAFCAEMTLSAGTSDGNYAPLEIELNIPSGASTGTKTAFMYLSAQGTDLSTFKSNGYLFILNGPTDTANGLFDATDVNDPDFTHALKIDINGTDYFIGLSTSVAFDA